MPTQVTVYRLKVILLGDGGVGKSSLIRQYVNRAFSEDYLKTLGTSISKRTEEFSLPPSGVARAELTIWDIMGQKQLFDLVKEAYLRGAQGALEVFDVTRRGTLEALGAWVAAARKENPSIAMVVLGNKTDLADRRAVTDAEALEYCAHLGLTYYPTSAKTGINVELAFRQIARKALGRQVALGEQG